MTKKKAEQFSEALLPWFRENKRDLPWRHNRTGYRVWISEIMLQQTRVPTVKSYYSNWMLRWPTLPSLAKADEQEVLKTWEGLGYYSRARNILKTAKQLEQAGKQDLPSNYEELLALPGIGQYTAGAVASLAFGKRVSAVDGNVLRVLSRYLQEPWQRGNSGALNACRTFLNIWLETMEKTDPAVFNEAIIELGALVCLPGIPRCADCPLQNSCEARVNNSQDLFPLPAAKTKRKTEYLTALVLFNSDSNKYAAVQRPSTGLLANLWEFPTIDGNAEETEVERQLEDWGYRVQSVQEIGHRTHVFSHLTWELDLYYAEVFEAPELTEWLWFTEQDLQNLPFSSALADVRNQLAADGSR